MAATTPIPDPASNPTEDEVDQRVDELLHKKYPNWKQLEGTRTIWHYEEGCMSMSISFGKISVATRDDEGRFNIIGAEKYQDAREPDDQRVELTLNRVERMFELGQQYCTEHHNHPMVKSASKR